MLRPLRSVLWEDLRRPEFETLDRGRVVVILPVASLEQHGPHLPAGTDIANARAVAVRAAELSSEEPVLVLPVIWTGVTPFHMVFQGTVTLEANTFVRVVVEICLSLAKQGFRRIVLLNSHGGNVGPVQTAVLSLRDHGLNIAAATSYWGLIPDEMAQLCKPDHGAMGHAAHGETSLQLYLQPQNVDRTAMTPEHKGTTGVWGVPTELMRGIYMTGDFARYAPTGIGGDHTQAKEGVGKSIIEAAGKALAAFIEAYRKIPLEG